MEEKQPSKLTLQERLTYGIIGIILSVIYIKYGAVLQDPIQTLLATIPLSFLLRSLRQASWKNCILSSIALSAGILISIYII